ncbi:hypothetical protein AK88_00627 [Plasmodium fragile]|uniref:Uncharacterized protein n=1 Tax=Plasmodium fragile TaxID=5857 RepID=A0A0D9QRJ1_PLAFR|nr:uncharacterized protein AK88_00627 [Plasmodium fragile]KJP89669.1 hypothetical protein AK88_00627 [Plasmodium fragile]
MKAADDVEEADPGDASILPNDNEEGDCSYSCAVDSPLGESRGEMTAEEGNGEAVTPSHNDATSYNGSPQSEEGCAKSETHKKKEANESLIQDNGGRQLSVQLRDGEGEREVITAGENETEDAPLSDASFSEAFFDQASQFQKAPEEPKGYSQAQLADLYKEIKKCETLFLSHFNCTGDDSTQMEMTSSGDEAKEERQEEKGKVSIIPQVDFTCMETIPQLIRHEGMSDHDDPPMEWHLRKHVQQFTQEQKKKNKKMKMNKYYIGVKNYLNTLPPSLDQKICKSFCLVP